jgi:fatty acid desaturase
MDIDALEVRGLDRETVLALSRPSDAKGLRQLAIQLAMLLATGSLVALSRGSWWLAPAIVLHGIPLAYLFCPLHEGVHRTAFASRWLNDWVAEIAGALIGLPAGFYRAFHFVHHRHTQDPARDPELAIAKPTTLAGYLYVMTGVPWWRNRVGLSLRHALTGRVPEMVVPAGRQRAIVLEARLIWALYLLVLILSIAFQSADALIFWLLPLVAGYPFLRFFLLAEHTGCAFGNDMFANTRTTYTNWAMRVLAWDMPYHCEHHSYPSVPFHALHKVNPLIRDRIVNSAPGYLAFHRNLIRTLASNGAGRRRDGARA